MTPSLLWRTRRRARIFPDAGRFYVLHLLGNHENTLLRAIRTIMCGLWAWKWFEVEEIDESGKFGTEGVSQMESRGAGGSVCGVGRGNSAGCECVGRAGERGVGGRGRGFFGRPDGERSAQLRPRRAVSPRSSQQAGGCAGGDAALGQRMRPVLGQLREGRRDRVLRGGPGKKNQDAIVG